MYQEFTGSEASLKALEVFGGEAEGISATVCGFADDIYQPKDWKFISLRTAEGVSGYWVPSDTRFIYLDYGAIRVRVHPHSYGLALTIQAIKEIPTEGMHYWEMNELLKRIHVLDIYSRKMPLSLGDSSEVRAVINAARSTKYAM